MLAFLIYIIWLGPWRHLSLRLSVISAAKDVYLWRTFFRSEGEEEEEAGALMPEACEPQQNLERALEQKYGTVISQQ